jgi:uncharacterized protein
MSRHRLPWLRRTRRSEPELPVKAPIQLGALSNGEIFRADTAESERAIRLIMEKAEEGARRHGIERREFLASSMGMATSLWAMNAVTGCGNDSRRPGSRELGDDATEQDERDATHAQRDASVRDSGSPRRDGGGRVDAGAAELEADGGYYDVPEDPTDEEQVCAKMIDPSSLFIFDIQTHHVNRANALYEKFLSEQSRFTRVCKPGSILPVECFSREEYVKLMFLESDTTVAVLSGLPAVDDANNPITNTEIADAKRIVDALAEDSERLINHHMVLPNQMGLPGVQSQLDAMERTLDVYRKVGAWKCYPAWAPENTEQVANGGWFLDDPQTGLKVVQKGLELGVGTFCIHKGLPIPAFSTKYNDPVDIGRVAKMFPAAKFIIYHSGYGHQGYNEGAYTMGSRQGTNSLITALLENGIKPNSNVFAELGTTWQLVSTLPYVGGATAAAHLLGKLLKYVGEDNVVWGTDSIWYGSPQAQIESFLQFNISEAFQRQYGYPALTMERKQKILGLNAARAYGLDVDAMRCAVDGSKLAMRKRELDDELGARRWAFHQPPLRTRRDFWAMHRRNGFRPG